jgi:hypothetical protein
VAEGAVAGRNRRGKTHECPWAEGAATTGNIQRKDMNVQWRKGLSLKETLEEGRTHEWSMGVVSCCVGGVVVTVL